MIVSLKAEPKQGAAIGNNCYKIRLAIASKGKGKSGGARIITHLQISQTKIFLLSIYNKSEQNDITDNDLNEWVKMIS